MAKSGPDQQYALSLWSPPAEPEIVVIEQGPRFRGPCLADVIDMYQVDPLSTFHKLRPKVRANQKNTLRRLRERRGAVPLATIKGRTIMEWHADWHGGSKVAMAHSFMALLRTVFRFGFTLLSDDECHRLSQLMSQMKFPMAPPRSERITAEQAEAIRMWAHIVGWPSIALAQAFQFDLMLRQKDVIGEWVPLLEDGASNIIWLRQKWMRGIRWNEISDNLILRHITSKRQKPVEVDLKLCPMVMEELELAYAPVDPDEPLIICESNAMPYSDSEFRRKFRIIANYAGVPRDVKNMDSRSGGITEAFEAGVAGDRIQKTATHSDIKMTMRYNRGDQRKASDEVSIGRASLRRSFDADMRAARWHNAQNEAVRPANSKRSDRGKA